MTQKDVSPSGHEAEQASGAELRQRLALVAAVSARLGGGGRFHENVAFLAREVARVLRADACVLRELRGEDLALLGVHGVPDGVLHDNVSAAKGIAGQLVREKRPMAFPHADEEIIAARPREDAGEKGRRFRYLSYAGAPMFADGRVIGLLAVYMTQTRREFDREDLDLLQIVANAVASAMANDRLFGRFAGADGTLRRQIAEMLGARTPASAHWETDESALGLVYDMTRALPDLEIHYQPMRVPGTFEVRGHEALARWRHPERGLIMPDDFIPLAEQTGHIDDIGFAVAERAVRVADNLAARHLGAFVSVNVSIVQLADAAFVDRLDALVAGARMDHARLVLEITERAILERDSEAGRTLARLSERGFPIFIDDFGAGYSSLSHLIDLPVSGVKIDRSFLPASPDDVRRRRMLATVAAMTRDLGMTVVSEGLEHPFQEEIAADLGIDLVQGYLIGMPATAGI